MPISSWERPSAANQRSTARCTLGRSYEGYAALTTGWSPGAVPRCARIRSARFRPSATWGLGRATASRNWLNNSPTSSRDSGEPCPSAAIRALYSALLMISVSPMPASALSGRPLWFPSLGPNT